MSRHSVDGVRWHVMVRHLGLHLGQDLGTIGYDGTYMHATVKMDNDSSPVSIDTEEIEQSTQSAKTGGRARDC